MSTYAALELLAACQSWANPATVVTRLRLAAALYEPAPPRPPGQVGRPRRKGQRLPILAAVATDPTTVWASVTIADWYGQGERTVEVASDTAVWYHGGLPAVPLRWVLIRDPQGAFATQALAWFVLRWQLAVTWEEARRHLGVETQRQWSELAIRRTTPVRRAAWYPKALRVPAAVGASPMPAFVANSGPTRVLRCPLATPIA